MRNTIRSVFPGCHIFHHVSQAHASQYCTLYCTAPVCRWLIRRPASGVRLSLSLTQTQRVTGSTAGHNCEAALRVESLAESEHHCLGFPGH